MWSRAWFRIIKGVRSRVRLRFEIQKRVRVQVRVRFKIKKKVRVRVRMRFKIFSRCGCGCGCSRRKMKFTGSSARKDQKIVSSLVHLALIAQKESLFGFKNDFGAGAV